MQYFISDIDFGSVFQQESDYRHMTSPRSPHERSDVKLAVNIDLSSLLDQQTRRLQIAFVAGPKQGRPSALVIIKQNRKCGQPSQEYISIYLFERKTHSK